MLNPKCRLIFRITQEVTSTTLHNHPHADTCLSPGSQFYSTLTQHTHTHTYTHRDRRCNEPLNGLIGEVHNRREQPSKRGKVVLQPLGTSLPQPQKLPDDRVTCLQILPAAEPDGITIRGVSLPTALLGLVAALDRSCDSWHPTGKLRCTYCQLQGTL